MTSIKPSLSYALKCYTPDLTLGGSISKWAVSYTSSFNPPRTEVLDTNKSSLSFEY